MYKKLLSVVEYKLISRNSINMDMKPAFTVT